MPWNSNEKPIYLYLNNSKCETFYLFRIVVVLASFVLASNEWTQAIMSGRTSKTKWFVSLIRGFFFINIFFRSFPISLNHTHLCKYDRHVYLTNTNETEKEDKTTVNKRIYYGCQDFNLRERWKNGLLSNSPKSNSDCESCEREWVRLSVRMRHALP